MQFHIFGNYEVNDVLSEVYMIGLDQIKKEEIRDPEKWVKGTAYNVIRQFRRKIKNHISLDSEKLTNLDCQNSRLNNLEISEELSPKNKDIFNSLSKENREIAWYRFIDEMSWKEIQIKMNTVHGKFFALATLRQRGKRIKQYLKSKLEEVNNNKN